MKKYGNKIIAILLTAVCLIGVLPLTVFGATEQVCYPAQGVWYPHYRYSASNGGFILAQSVKSLILPLPGDSTVTIVGVEGTPVESLNHFYLDANFYHISSVIVPSDVGSFTLYDVPSNAVYVTIGYNFSTPDSSELEINGVSVSIVEGEYTLAHPSYCEDVVIPDEPTDVDIAGNVLTMWQHFLSDNLDNLANYYEQLTIPIALIIGIPLCIAICTLIFTCLGGKKR